MPPSFGARTAFSERIQVGRFQREPNVLDACIPQYREERVRILRIAIVDQITTAVEKSVVGKCQLPRDLFHESRVGRVGHTC